MFWKAWFLTLLFLGSLIGSIGILIGEFVSLVGRKCPFCRKRISKTATVCSATVCSFCSREQEEKK